MSSSLWIKVLYSNPTAKILTNQTLSTQFRLNRGTRQGCVLSPLWFALALEPLAEAIRSHPDKHGYNTEYTTNKISLYAEDILLYVSQPRITIPSILSVTKAASSVDRALAPLCAIRGYCHASTTTGL